MKFSVRTRGVTPIDNSNQHFVEYSPDNRASLVDFSMPARRRPRTRASTQRKRRRTHKRRTITGGRLRIKLGRTNKSIVAVPTSSLVHYIPVNSLKSAARRFLRERQRKRNVRRSRRKQKQTRRKRPAASRNTYLF